MLKPQKSPPTSVSLIFHFTSAIPLPRKPLQKRHHLNHEHTVNRLRFSMETDETDRVLPFQLQFDKPVASQVKIAEWNPEKDLLAMVTEDSKILLHRFNWQRLWTVSPGNYFYLPSNYFNCNF